MVVHWRILVARFKKEQGLYLNLVPAAPTRKLSLTNHPNPLNEQFLATATSIAHKLSPPWHTRLLARIYGHDQFACSNRLLDYSPRLVILPVFFPSVLQTELLLCDKKADVVAHRAMNQDSVVQCFPSNIRAFASKKRRNPVIRTYCSYLFQGFSFCFTQDLVSTFAMPQLSGLMGTTIAR